MSIREWIAEYNEEALLADGFEEAIVGVCERIGHNTVVAYDREKCINILVEDFEESITTMDMDDDDPDRDLYEEAEEYFSYNVIGSYVGENTPVFITFYPVEETQGS
tara:strand:- start:3689 stop:4009 length:321 start_codon:yes stop_codon:yes gene_type:complete